MANSPTDIATSVTTLKTTKPVSLRKKKAGQDPAILKQLSGLLDHYEYTYSESFSLIFNSSTTAAHGMYTLYLGYVLRKKNINYEESSHFSPDDFLRKTFNDSRPFQYVVLCTKGNTKATSPSELPNQTATMANQSKQLSEYKITLRIGRMNHGMLALGNDHRQKLLEIPKIRALQERLNTIPKLLSEVSLMHSPAKKLTTSSPESTLRVLADSKINYDEYQQEVAEHFKDEMPRVILAGDIYNQNGRVIINDRSGGFHFKPNINQTLDQAIDKKNCTRLIMELLGLPSDDQSYQPMNKIDLNDYTANIAATAAISLNSAANIVLTSQQSKRESAWFNTAETTRTTLLVAATEPRLAGATAIVSEASATTVTTATVLNKEIAEKKTASEAQQVRKSANSNCFEKCVIL